MWLQPVPSWAVVIYSQKLAADFYFLLQNFIA